MRKIAAIFLLGLLLFNWFGYRVLIGYWQERAKIKLEARLDVNDYDESQLISVKVPVTHLAYYNSSAAFERVNGSVEILGVQYKYVKRRLYNDSLELLCLPDQGAMKLRASVNRIWNMPVRTLIDEPYVLTPGYVTLTPFVFIGLQYNDLFFSLPCRAPGAHEQPPDGIA